MRPILHGMLIIDKPAGWTSHDVVGWVRKWSGERKVGHAGTLDPAATGVLPIAINDGTRVLEFLTDANKAYVAEITFGIATDSCDIDGNVIEHDSAEIGAHELDAALANFRGPIQQQPPAHSAIRVNGKRAYELARSGDPVEMPIRTVEILDLNTIGFDRNVLTIAIACTKGTYIRSIARDLGKSVGSCAFLSNLVRTRSGPYVISDAWTISELIEIDPVAEWESVALHPDSALPEWPSVLFNKVESIDWLHGRRVSAIGHPERIRSRVYDEDGRWLGLGEFDQPGQNWNVLRVIGRP